MGKFKISQIFAVVVCALMVWSSTGLAKDQREQLHEDFIKNVQGKTVAWAPLWYGVLETEWTNVMRANFERYGMKFIARDGNFKADVQLQAVEYLISLHPDVLVVQSANSTNLARVIKKAMNQGIYVVQVNMPSVQVSDAYVGISTAQVGREMADDIIKDVGGGKTSGEVAIIEGDAAAPYSYGQANAAVAEFKKDPSIKVVTRQPCDWDSNKARKIISTVIQEYPKLAAVYSVWGPQTAGVGQALRNAGSSAKVWITSDGQMPDCDQMGQGFAYKLLSYRADVQGETIVNAVLTLLQNHDKPGTKRLAYYTALYWVKSPADFGYCWIPKK
jgi:ABC-type sugar transport system substrate-binding protein